MPRLDVHGRFPPMKTPQTPFRDTHQLEKCSGWNRCQSPFGEGGASATPQNSQTPMALQAAEKLGAWQGRGFSLKGTGFRLKGTGFRPYIIKAPESTGFSP